MAERLLARIEVIVRSARCVRVGSETCQDNYGSPHPGWKHPECVVAALSDAGLLTENVYIGPESDAPRATR